MEENKFSIINSLVSKGDFLLAMGIIGILGGLIVPLPPLLIDLLLAFNIGSALVIIMVSNFIEKPLHFSSFPSVLLFSALLRIGMNVATTRKILLTGYAGEIIDAFGQFVVGGNYIVGVVIFIIIIVIQVMVITSGTTRISEVAARFTLDAMPGKQMSIDADLNSGLITEDEARAKREELSRESDFYGSMDGAAKFVRGDVTAGMIITAINIIGGIVLGMFHRGMLFTEALAKYTLLTVGDGLVAQVPSVVISVAAGIIVTRAGSSKDSLGKELIGQMVIHPKATGIGAFALFLGGLIPSMPLFPFWSIGGALGFMSLWVKNQSKKADALKEKEMQQQEEEKTQGPEPVDNLLYVDTMSIEIGYGLISLVDTSKGGDLLERINNIRRQFASELGLIVPPIRIRDNMQLNPNEYSIKIKENEIALNEIIADSWLAMNPEGNTDELFGIQTTEPAFGLPATWVNQTEKNRAESLGYTVVEPATVLATHMKEIIKKYGYELLLRQDVQGMVDNLKKRYPAVVEDVIPAKISIAQVHRILQNLLREQVPIRNLMTIFEVIGDYAHLIKDIDIMTEYIRNSLRMEISRVHAGESKELFAITLEPKLEKMLSESINKTEVGTAIFLDPIIKSQVIEAIAKSVTNAGESGISPVLLVSPAIRLYFKKMVEKELSSLPILSFSEISEQIKVTTLDMVSLENNLETAHI